MSGLLALALCVCQGMMAQDTLKKFDLQELVVTGTGTLHLLKDAPVQTEVITGKQLKNFGGRSLQEILSGLATGASSLCYYKALQIGDASKVVPVDNLSVIIFDRIYLLLLIHSSRNFISSSV